MLTDDWNGFREKRSEIIGKLAGMGNVVAITGDVHSFYASTPTVNGDPTKKIVEIVGSSISSMTLKSIVITTLKTDPFLSTVAGADALAADLDGLFLAKDTKINPHLGYAQSASNGYVTVEVSGTEFVATMHRIGEKEVITDYTGKAADLKGRMSTVKFRVNAGERELYQEIGGAWKKWDMETLSWV
jgi:alkaline phosphatase D